MKRVRGIKPKVIDAILSGYCNTTRDVADETGLSVATCSACLNKFAADGIIHWTDRFIPIDHYRLRVFEVAA